MEVKSIPQTESSTSARIARAEELYGIQRWGCGYFGISSDGNVVVDAPTATGHTSIELIEIVAGLRARGLDMPVLLRLANLVDDRIIKVNEAFQRAILEAEYLGQYRGVFPIKVNQQRHVIAEIARAGAAYGHGFEVGSKAELLIALSELNSHDSLIVCNGYKDTEFVDLGLQAIRLGFKCFFVLETPQELAVILERAKYWGVQPLLGVRMKLSTQVDGHWSNDSGDRSLFGLTTRHLIEIVDRLRDEAMLDSLQLLHFHLGSQIPNIRNVRDGIREACRYYLELLEIGAPLGYLNIGGGLAVDYDGSGSNQANSRNYTLDEYCIDVVETIASCLKPEGAPHPVIVSESGRWTVAPMSVLLFNVLSVNTFDAEPLPDAWPENLSDSIAFLLDTLQHLQVRRLQENYNDAIYYRDQLRQDFRIGRISLRERALGENLCLTILNRIAAMVPELDHPPPELEQMRHQLSDIYYGNFSVFQSLPDAWAIDQVFPVMPLHRLDEEPTRDAIIADLTCDCDGKLDRFVLDGQHANTLKLHELREGEEYYLGVFLVGAYQETLGDLHNLFGDTHVANVQFNEQGEVEFVQEIHGDSIADVLSYVEYQPDGLYQRFRQVAEQAVREGLITVNQRQEMLSLYSDGLRGYTYFEN